MKFSIRDLLLVTVIVALAVGWWVHYRAMEVEIKAVRRQLYDAQFPKMYRTPSAPSLMPPED